MPKIEIDHRDVDVPEGGTILDGARILGIEIPTLCHCPPLPPQTSCFVCVVQVDGRDDLIPACATRAVEGMVVSSQSDTVRDARRRTLELLLSDHLGDCIAPCQAAFDGEANIPAVLRAVTAGDFARAALLIHEKLDDPAEKLAAMSPRFENACRRRAMDRPISILAVLKYVVANHKSAADAPGDEQNPLDASAGGFSTHIGAVTDAEHDALLAEVGTTERSPAQPGKIDNDQAAANEAARCLHCDCRKPHACLLRRYAAEYRAKPAAFRAETRRPFRQDRSHPELIYEPGKCIGCGLCVAVTKDANEPIGLAMVGRGYDARPAVPFGHSLSDALTTSADRCVETCPTGALAHRKT